MDKFFGTGFNMLQEQAASFLRLQTLELSLPHMKPVWAIPGFRKALKCVAAVTGLESLTVKCYFSSEYAADIVGQWSTLTNLTSLELSFAGMFFPKKLELFPSVLCMRKLKLLSLDLWQPSVTLTVPKVRSGSCEMFMVDTTNNSLVLLLGSSLQMACYRP